MNDGAVEKINFSPPVTPLIVDCFLNDARTEDARKILGEDKEPLQILPDIRGVWLDTDDQITIRGEERSLERISIALPLFINNFDFVRLNFPSLTECPYGGTKSGQ